MRIGRGRCASPRGGSSSWWSVRACRFWGRPDIGWRPPRPRPAGQSCSSTWTHTLVRLQRVPLDVNVSPQEELAVHLLLRVGDVLQSWWLRRFSMLVLYPFTLLLIPQTFNLANNCIRNGKKIVRKKTQLHKELQLSSGMIKMLHLFSMSMLTATHECTFSRIPSVYQQKPACQTLPCVMPQMNSGQDLECCLACHTTTKLSP